MSEAFASGEERFYVRRKGATWAPLAGLFAAGAFSLALPHLFASGFAQTMLSIVGITIIFALSYNILLGQTGMLSFGHAVYYGLGAYFTVHAINAITAAKVLIPLPLLPLVGGVAGLLFAALFGWVSTKRSGTAFAMISLGLAELVGSSSLILRSFFGGEEGVSTNRTALVKVFGVSFGPQIQMYYLIAFWCLASAAAMYGLTRTPFGRLCNAVRENPERVAFIGYNPQRIRFMAFCFAGFFAGIAGGLAGINFELANAALFSANQSALGLVAAVLGGAGYFLGPVLGAAIVVYLQTMLSDVTDVWQLYFGILFIGVVMFAPGGLMHLIMIHRPLLRARTAWRLLPSYAAGLATMLVLLAGVILGIEILAHIALKSADGPAFFFFGFKIDTRDWVVWVIVGLAVVCGAFALRFVSTAVGAAWDRARSASVNTGLQP